jgi:hypothetical protein
MKSDKVAALRENMSFTTDDFTPFSSHRTPNFGYPRPAIRSAFLRDWSFTLRTSSGIADRTITKPLRNADAYCWEQRKSR